jgi:antirestriction protein ArdC
MNDVPSHTTRDAYSAITDKIVEAMNAGVTAFTMPWHRIGVGIARPTNAVSGYVYRAGNVIALWAAAAVARYESGYWASYRQWQHAGAQVRKGERSSVILFYKEIAPESDDGGDEPPRRFYGRAYRLFNAQQVDGWKAPEPVLRDLVQSLEQVEAFVAATGADIQHVGDQARYRPGKDLIDMPPRERFIGSPTSTPTEAYYATLLHELIHWTGAPHRLARALSERFGDQAYAMEELVAELGAAFLCADLGVANDPRPDMAAYIDNWLHVLKHDKKAIFTAARSAQKAVEYLAMVARENVGSQ